MEFDYSKSYNFKPSFWSEALEMVLLYMEQGNTSLIFVCLYSYINSTCMSKINEHPKQTEKETAYGKAF